MGEAIVILIIFISLISTLLSIPIVTDYFEYQKNPIDILLEYIKDVRIIGDIAFGLLLIMPWILSIMFYLIIIIFYNKYTIKLMNVKVK